MRHAGKFVASKKLEIRVQIDSMKKRLKTCPRLVLLALLLTSLSACGGIEIHETNPVDSYVSSQLSSLSTAELSEQSRQFLELHDLTTIYEESPYDTSLQLIDILKKDKERLAAFVLAELCYQQGKIWQGNLNLQGSYITSAVVYAYAYLFDTELGASANHFNPNYRRACEIYNRSLAHLVNYHSQSGDEYKGKSSFDLPLLNGSLNVRRGAATLAWDPNSFDKFLVSYDYEIEGVGTMNRIYGLGTPCVALRSPPEEEEKGLQDRYLPKLQQAYATTVVLRMKGSVLTKDLPGSDFHAVIELYDPSKTTNITVNGQGVALESDFTTPLVYMFKNAPEPEGISGLLDVEGFNDKKGLYMLQPYQKGKIPVVFIHGLLSTPSTWIRMINGVMGDPELRAKYQPWFFFYPTGNPILLSASVLRESLLKVRKAFDPKKEDKAFDEMVLVGHSMGGVISRLQCQESEDRFWSLLSKKPLESYDFSEDQKALIQRVFWFKPVPHISRAIFLAAPHRGSNLAKGIFGAIGNWLTKVPITTVKSVQALGAVFQKESDPRLFQDYPTGIASLSPDNPFNEVGASLKFAKRIRYHTIVGNVESANQANGSDGIVAYTSSLLKGARSELIVKSGHSVHSHPTAILEVRRILKLHLKENAPKK